MTSTYQVQRIHRLKICTGCGEAKPLVEFYKLLSGPRLGQYIQPCKPCNYAKAKAWRLANQETYKRSCHKTRMRYKKKYYAVQAKWIKANPKKINEMVTRWQANNPERSRLTRETSQKVQRAIKMGVIKRPTTCENCGRTNCAIQSAHKDYSKPFDIRWLCVPCHRQWDYDEPKTLHARTELQPTP